MISVLSKKLLTWFQEKQPEIEAMLEQLVNIDSGSACKAGVDQVADIMAEEYRKLGFAVELLRHENCGNAVIARRPGRNSTKNLLLICHIDTAFPPNYSAEHPYYVKDGRAYGNGVEDMKICFINCLYAIKALDALRVDPLVGITVLMSGDEEAGSISVLDEIKAEGKKADWCIVTEGARANGAFVKERKGNAQLDVWAHGRAAHAGNEPEKGRNAIEELALKIVKLRQIANPALGSTVTIGTIQGGKNRILTAEDAAMQVDLRFRTLEEKSRMFAAVEEILAQPEIDGVQLRYELRYNRPPLTSVPGAEKLYASLKRISEALEIPYLSAVAGGVSDGNFVADMGVPTIDGLGPVGGMMCSPEEYLELDSIAPRGARMAALMADLVNL